MTRFVIHKIDVQSFLHKLMMYMGHNIHLSDYTDDKSLIVIKHQNCLLRCQWQKFFNFLYVLDIHIRFLIIQIYTNWQNWYWHFFFLEIFTDDKECVDSIVLGKAAHLNRPDRIVACQLIWYMLSHGHITITLSWKILCWHLCWHFIFKLQLISDFSSVMRRHLYTSKPACHS